MWRATLNPACVSNKFIPVFTFSTLGVTRPVSYLTVVMAQVAFVLNFVAIESFRAGDKSELIEQVVSFFTFGSDVSLSSCNSPLEAFYDSDRECKLVPSFGFQSYVDNSAEVRWMVDQEFVLCGSNNVITNMLGHEIVFDKSHFYAVRVSDDEGFV